MGQTANEVCSRKPRSPHFRRRNFLKCPSNCVDDKKKLSNARKYLGMPLVFLFKQVFNIVTKEQIILDAKKIHSANSPPTLEAGG